MTTEYDPHCREALSNWLKKPKTVQIDTPQAALDIILPMLTENGKSLDQERVVVIAVSRNLRVIDATVISAGSLSYTVFSSQQIMRWAMTREYLPSGLVLAHNHPSGDPEPSPEDRTVTERTRKAAQLLEINLLDHIIVGASGDYCSMAERFLIPKTGGQVPGPFPKDNMQRLYGQIVGAGMSFDDLYGAGTDANNPHLQNRNYVVLACRKDQSVTIGKDVVVSMPEIGEPEPSATVIILAKKARELVLELEKGEDPDSVHFFTQALELFKEVEAELTHSDIGDLSAVFDSFAYDLEVIDGKRDTPEGYEMTLSEKKSLRDHLEELMGCVWQVL